MSVVAKATPNSNGNLFEVKTVQSGAFRTLIEALKEILTEANLEFDSQGIKIVAVDETHTVLVYLRLHADRFENYYCPVKHVLGVNMIYLFKLIKTMGNNDSLTLYLPANNPNKLGIRMENTEKSQVTNFFLKLFDTDVEDISIPSLNFTSIIHMHNLIFRCVGDFAEQETIIADNQASMKVQTKGTTNEIVQGIFQLKHLVLFTKCTTLCPSIELYLKNDYPLILRYMVANLGEVKLVLAPIKNKKE